MKLITGLEQVDFTKYYILNVFYNLPEYRWYFGKLSKSSKGVVFINVESNSNNSFTYIRNGECFPVTGFIRENVILYQLTKSELKNFVFADKL